MLKIDKDYKNNITIKSTVQTELIKLNNKSKDSESYPFWFPLNGKDVILKDFFINETVDYKNSLKEFYFYYSENILYITCELNKIFLEKLNSTLYKGTLSAKKDILSCLTENNSMFFNIDYLVYKYNQENLIKENYYKNDFQILTNLKEEIYFVKYNPDITEEELFIIKNAFDKDNDFVKESIIFEDYLKINNDLLMNQKKVLLSLYNDINEIILSDETYFKEMAKKYKKEYQVAFVPFLFFYFNDKATKRRIDILKYFPVSDIDYSIMPYCNLASILLKNDNIETSYLKSENFNSQYKFTVSPINILIEHCCFNTDCIKEAFLYICDKISKKYKNDFKYTLIIPKT